MSPKTPHSAFRLSEETRQQLASIAEQYQTSMTEAVRMATAAMASITEAAHQASSRYPFEAYSDALAGYREAMGYEPGHVISDVECNAVDVAVMRAIPYLREEQHYDTLRDVIVRLEGMGVDPDVVQHFRGLLPQDEDATKRGVTRPRPA